MESIWTKLVLLLLLLCIVASGQDADFWNNQAIDSIQNAELIQDFKIRQAKNVIFFLGDGMSVATVTAARIREGQLAGQTGEENSLAWEDFPFAGMIKTYNTDAQTPDSAGTATAFFCGVKTKSGVIGIDDDVIVGYCNSTFGNEVDSILTQAYVNKNIATGIVSTARITHATPSALYAHVPTRSWESNNDIPLLQKNCKDIALQLVEDSPYIKVILGGGRQNFYDVTERDPEDPSDRGHRTDGRNLIDEWLEGKPNAQYVWNKNQFDDVDVDSTEYLLGLFEDSHMRYANEAEEGNDPSLASMTEKAIKILQKDDNGFFLAVEGGRIDHAHHGGYAHQALDDTVALSDAVAMAKSLTSPEDTLIVVTADHAHTLGIAGYPLRGNPILGLTGGEDGLDKLPFTTLGYINGPGGEKVQGSYEDTGKRPNLTDADTEERYFKQDAIVPLSSETHGGEDVIVYASGPMAHFIDGVHEQNYIAHVVRFAGCYDDEEMNVCNTDITVPTPKPETTPSRAPLHLPTSVLVTFVSLLSFLFNRA